MMALSSLLTLLARGYLGLAAPHAATPAYATPSPAAPAHVQPTAPAKAMPPAPVGSTPVTADVAVASVQAFYKEINQVTAQFRQTVKNSTFGTGKDSDGKVWLLKPGKMRWDYYEKKPAGVQVKKSFLSNGSTLFVIEHDNKQVVKKNLAQDLMPVAVSFLYGKGDLAAEFTPEIDSSGTYGTPADLVLKLTPKQPSAQYKYLFLVVNRVDFHVSQSVIIDSSNNSNQFKFFAPDFKKSIADSWFEFDERSVKNYRVIDADQQQQDKAGAAAMPAPMPPGTTTPVPAAATAPAPAPAKKP